MATSLNFRDIVDLPEWRQLSQPVLNNVSSVTLSGGNWFSEDLRNNDYGHPIVYYNGTSTNFSFYNQKNDAWGCIFNSGFGLGGTFGVGSTSVFVPSFSPKGLLTNSGNTTTKITLNTALPASVTINQLANRGDGKGFIIRIIGNGIGGSGKIEERRVIANTSGTTPTLILDVPLSFTPNNTNSDSYEFLSGSYLSLNTGALTAGQFRRYDVLTSSYYSLSTTSLIATVPATSNLLYAIDEGYVPCNRLCGEGMLVGASTYGSNAVTNLAGTINGAMGCLLATSSAAGTLTGQTVLGDANIIANQFRNYQIRIVEDTVIPDAVGQRRKITSHTAGVSPVYTLASNWTVTPSTDCKYVIENWTENVIALIGGQANVYNYTHSNYTGGTADTWSSATWAVKPNSLQTTGAFGFHSFGIVPDELNISKCSNIHLFRGASSTFDTFDIAGGVTGLWTASNSIKDYAGSTYDAVAASDVTHVAYNPHTQEGKYVYLFTGTNSSSTTLQRSAVRFDCKTFKAEKIAGMRSVSGSTTTNSASNASWISLYQDGATKIAFYNTHKPLIGSDFWQLMLIR